MKNTILLSSGKYYSFTHPEKNVFDINDIALGLSHICRFNGQIEKPYYVAQHSVYVSYAVPEEYALDGLLHDSAEAFLGDVTQPLKLLLPDYQAMEQKHEADIFARFGVEYPLNKYVKQADLAVFAAEVKYLQPKDTHWDCLSGITTFDWEITPWSSKVAKEAFLRRYNELMQKRKEKLC